MKDVSKSKVEEGFGRIFNAFSKAVRDYARAHLREDIADAVSKDIILNTVSMIRLVKGAYGNMYYNYGVFKQYIYVEVTKLSLEDTTKFIIQFFTMDKEAEEFWNSFERYMLWDEWYNKSFEEFLSGVEQMKKDDSTAIKLHTSAYRFLNGLRLNTEITPSNAVDVLKLMTIINGAKKMQELLDKQYESNEIDNDEQYTVLTNYIAKEGE